MHVTFRVLPDLGSLRTKEMFFQLREATIATARRTDFRINHLSIQRDHLHLIVEADSKEALSAGIRGFEVSAAKRINRELSRELGIRRTGRVVGDRYHARALTTPRAVRNCLAYVLNNWRHHGEDRGSLSRHWLVDPYSSGVQFPGWQELADSPGLFRAPAAYYPLLVWCPRTWLLKIGWSRHHALIAAREVPGAARA